MQPWDTGSIGAAGRPGIGTSTTTSKTPPSYSMAGGAAQSSAFPFRFDATSNRALQDPPATQTRTHHVFRRWNWEWRDMTGCQAGNPEKHVFHLCPETGVSI